MKKNILLLTLYSLLLLVKPIYTMENNNDLEYFNIFRLAHAACQRDTDLVYCIIRTAMNEKINKKNRALLQEPSNSESNEYESDTIRCPYCDKEMKSFIDNMTQDKLHTSNIKRHMYSCSVVKKLNQRITEKYNEIFPNATAFGWTKVTINSKRIGKKKRAWDDEFNLENTRVKKIKSSQVVEKNYFDELKNDSRILKMSSNVAQISHGKDTNENK